MQFSLLLTQDRGNELILKKDLAPRNADDRYKYAYALNVIKDTAQEVIWIATWKLTRDSLNSIVKSAEKDYLVLVITTKGIWGVTRA